MKWGIKLHQKILKQPLRIIVMNKDNKEWSTLLVSNFQTLV
jgi:hypothetical protein